MRERRSSPVRGRVKAWAESLHSSLNEVDWAEIQTWRHAEQPSTVGIDVMEIVITGTAPQGKIVTSCTGYAKQVPDLVFDVTLVRMSDDELPELKHR